MLTLERAQDTITWQQWAKSKAVEPKVRDRRVALLNELARANGKQSPTELIDDIFADKITPYSAALAYVDAQIEKGLKPGTVRQYRSMLPNFFKSVLGERNFSQTAFDNIVEAGKGGTTQVSKKSPKVEELKHLFNIATPRDRALLAILCSGMRIGEAVSRKMSDLEPQENGEYYRIKLWAEETKSEKKRYVYVTKETYNWIKLQHNGNPSKYCFPSLRPGTKERGEARRAGKAGDYHITVARAYDAIKALFIAGGLKDEFKEDSKYGAGEIYSPHSMRTFAENYMIRCGLPEKYVYAITSHTSKMGATTHYLDWDEIGKSWYEICSDKMTWLQEIVRISEHDPQQDMRIKDLERKLNATLKVLASLGKTSPERMEALISENFPKLVEAEEKKQILREMQDRPSKELPE
jgi:integrase